VASSTDGRPSLWLRSLDSLEAHELVNDGVQPFWSPDSRYLGFHSRGKLKTIAVTGGAPQTLTDSYSQTGAWSAEGVILFKATDVGGLSRISAAGGPVTPVTAPDTSLGETAHEWPHFLPDGNHFIYLARSRQPEHDGVLYAASLDSSDRVRLFKSDSNAAFAAPGLLVYMAGNTLVARGFDAGRLRVTGEPISIAEQVERNAGSLRAALSVSQNGVLAYRPIRDSELVWFDRTGQRIETIGSPGRYSNPAISPDDAQLAVARVDSETGTTDIWLLELARNVASRFTFDSGYDDMPLWSPDGRDVVFKSNRNATWAFFRKAANGDGPEELMFEPEGRSIAATPLAWSPDSRFLVYTSSTQPVTLQRNELWLLPLTGDRTPAPFLQSPFNVLQGRLSPDSRWMAYVSNESGRNEVYVRPFPSGEGKRQISLNGGSDPAWRGDGGELFYLAANQDMMVVTFEKGSILKTSPPARLFGTGMATGLINPVYTRNQYVVAADGRRFLINQAAALPSPITVVLNWTVTLGQ
jgi:Tol biopolymer transport system component